MRRILIVYFVLHNDGLVADCVGGIWDYGVWEEVAMEHVLRMGKDTDLEESLALFALLRSSPRGVSWGEVAGEVRRVGSAVEVLENWTTVEGALLPNPILEESRGWATYSVNQWKEAGLEWITVLSEHYPARLAEVFDSPPFLFVSGDVRRDDPGMSVVGSRKASPQGVRLAELAAELLVEREMSVIAGLAEGIDAAAHRRALALDGRTVAVIGTGIKRYYPATNRGLQDEISKSGLVISQFYPDQPPTKATFPMRNATMSGYGMATIVVEAGEYSGTRIQARQAADHGRPVILSGAVAEQTAWGSEMAKDPWVMVVESRDELEAAIDQVREDAEGSLVQQLGLA